MSRKRDWDRARTREAQHAPIADRHYDGPPLVDPLEPLIQKALEAKRSGQIFRMPQGIKDADRRRLWRAVYGRLGLERATGGPAS